MNRLRLILHRLFRKPALTGPMRLYTRRLPDGVLMDLEEYFTHVVTTIADDPDLMDLLGEIEEDRRNAHTHRHDGWEPEQLLVERLATAVGYEVPVRGEALTALASKLQAAAPKQAPAVVIPAQARRAA